MFVRGWMAAGLALLVLAAGCGEEKEGSWQDSRAPAEQSKAERLLTDALDRLSGQRQPYRSSVSVETGGLAMPGPQALSDHGPAEADDGGFGLYDLIDFARTARKTVRTENGPDGTVLAAAFDSGDWTMFVEQALRKRLSRLEQKESALRDSLLPGLSPERSARMEKELQDATAPGKEMLAAAVRSLDAKGTLRIWLSPGDGLPGKLLLENEMQYETGGGALKEFVVSRYSIP